VFDTRNRVEYGKSMGEPIPIHPPTEPDFSNVNVIHKRVGLKEQIATHTKDFVTVAKRKLVHPMDTLTDIFGKMGNTGGRPF